MKLKLLLSLVLISISLNLYGQQPPESPVLTEPPKLAIIVPLDVYFQWAVDPTADSYTLQVATDNSFQNIVVNVTGIVETNYKLAEGILSPNTVYYWEVIAVNQYGSTNSQIWNFTTAGTPIQDITQLADKVDYFVSSNLLQVQQGIILNNRLSTAIIQLSHEHNFQAVLQMLLFDARVSMLINSNILSEENGQALIDYSCMIINFIYEGNAPIFNPQITEHTFGLKQNYPNPFNPSTTIEYTIPQNSHVTLKIYDIQGREIATLVNKYQNSGSYIVIWNASNFSSGVYFYKLIAGNRVETKRMLLSK